MKGSGFTGNNALLGKSRLSLLCVLSLLVIASIWVLHLERQPRIDKRLPSGISGQDIDHEQARILEEPPVRNVKPVNWITRNGARVYFIPAHELPMVDIALKFDAGSARDGQYYGLANLTGLMLSQGEGKQPGAEVVREFEQLGAVYRCETQHDFTMVSLRSLSEKGTLLPAIELLARVVAKPAFSQHALSRKKHQVQAAIRLRKQLPAFQVERIFWRTLYADHPYGHSIIGDDKSISSFNRQQLQCFHQRHYVARNLVISLTGNINEEEARTLADNISAPLAEGEPLAALPPPVALTKNNRRSLVMATEQTHICIGQMGIQRNSPDLAALKVGNYILRCKRLYPEVRGNRGLSYQVSSDFIAMKMPGPLIIQLQTRNDYVAEALAVVQDVLKEFVENGITQDELDEARHYLRGSYPLSLANNSAMVTSLSKIGFFDLPLEHMDQYMREVQQLTVEQVNKAIKKQLKLDALLQVTVGRDVSPAAEE